MSHEILYDVILVVFGVPGVIVMWHEWREKRAMKREKRLLRWIKRDLPEPPTVDVAAIERDAEARLRAKA